MCRWIRSLSARLAVLLGIEPLDHSYFLTRQYLIGMKTRALRRRIWFKALSRVERGLVDLTIAWVNRVKSISLAIVLTEILRKLALAVEGTKFRTMELGRRLAMELSDLAVSWGSEQARPWRSDKSFHLFLASMASDSRNYPSTGRGPLLY